MRPIASTGLALLAVSWVTACAGAPAHSEPDLMEVTLPVPAERVSTAVVDVLTEGGYRVERDDAGNITTGMRREIRSPWNGLLRWRFGVGKSRVEARVIPQDEANTRLRLQVFHRGKDGLFDSWEEAETPLPQSAENEIRLIKKSLRLL